MISWNRLLDLRDKYPSLSSNFLHNMVQAQWTGAQARWGKCVCVYVCVCVCLAEIGLGGNLWSPVHLGAQAVGCTHKLLEPLSRGELLEPLGRGG